MKNKMILREFQKEDTREMIDIIRKTWHYDEFCSHKPDDDGFLGNRDRAQYGQGEDQSE